MELRGGGGVSQISGVVLKLWPLASPPPLAQEAMRP